MSSQKTSNNDSCRDLSGRRLSTIKEAKKYVFLSSLLSSTFFLISFFRLADYIEQEPARLAAKAEAQKQKLEQLERKLGIDSESKKASGSNSPPPDVLAGKKHRFDDTEYLEKSQELKDNVKNAVAAALLKKKKAKLSHPTSSDGSLASDKKEKEDVKKIIEKEKVKAALVSAQPLAPAPEAIGA